MIQQVHIQHSLLVSDDHASKYRLFGKKEQKNSLDENQVFILGSQN